MKMFLEKVVEFDKLTKKKPYHFALSREGLPREFFFFAKMVSVWKK